MGTAGGLVAGYRGYVVRTMRRLGRWRREQRGVSLLELVVGLAILVVALLPFLSCLATASRGVSLSRYRLEALELLVLAAEETRTGLEGGTIGEPSAPVTQTFEHYGGTEFVLTRTLEPVGHGTERMVRVRLSLALGDRNVVEAVFLWYRWYRPEV